MNKIVIVIIVVCLSAIPNVGWSYGIETHKDLTGAAIKASALGISDLLARIGVRGPIGINSTDDAQKFPDSRRTPNAVFSLIRNGAGFEDDPATKVRNHFYNPIDNSPLTMGVAVGCTSPDWALDNAGQIDNSRCGKQDFSYSDARGYFYNALTKPLEVDRKKNYGLLFESLGHIAHHMQDMAQPQHVRSDQHLEINKDSLAVNSCTLSVILPPLACIAYLSLRNPSVYEAYSDRVNGTDEFKAYYASVTPVFGESSSRNFSHPRDFWDETYGIAKYTNRNFVSAGTNFDTHSINVLPKIDPAVPPAVDIKTLVPGTALRGKVTFFGSLAAAPGLGDVANPRASSRSIFDWDLTTYGGTTNMRAYALNRINYDVAQSILIPRAVNYSAGLINFFFRGKLTVKPTAQGVFSVIDQLPPLGGKSGFTKIKAQLRNDTPDITTTGDPLIQGMTNGTLVAVAKFKRNQSFFPDSNGVYMLPPPGAPISFFEGEEILISNPLSASNDVAIPSGTAPAVTVTFNFDPANPIPVNATDLSLQFVYRGTLGAETDAVVVQTVDVSEPTLINASNDLDYSWDANNVLVAATEQQLAERTLPAIYFVFASGTAPTLSLTGFSISAPVAPGKYAAVWTLVDLAAPPSYGTAYCAQCGYSLTPVVPRRVESKIDGSDTKLVSPAPYKMRGTWQINGTTRYPVIPTAVCGTGSFADCLTTHLPPYNPLVPTARVAIDF